ncbi:MAG: paraquat-inducible protein A [Gammaproteobacteria bacterium]
MTAVALTAKNAGMVSCHACGLLVKARSLHHGHGSCPRCGGALHLRKANSIARCWALLIAAAICYIPANVLPIMTVISFGEGEPDTIVSGLKALIAVGMYPVAILVFFASIFVPVLKLILFTFLLISVQTKSAWRPRDRTVMYRITEAVGRWSMVDIFMISILAALVKLGSIATIEPGAGAGFFAAVVVMTMFAAMAFDPRLIWDAMESEDD